MVVFEAVDVLFLVFCKVLLNCLDCVLDSVRSPNVALYQITRVLHSLYNRRLNLLEIDTKWRMYFCQYGLLISLSISVTRLVFSINLSDRLLLAVTVSASNDTTLY